MTPVIITTNSTQLLNTWLKANVPDFKLDREIQPEKKNLTLAEVKYLSKHFHLSSGENEKLLYIIHQADTLTIPAQNSLLKTLEESPENRLIILSVSNPNRLLPTIISRCLTVTLSDKTSPQSLTNLLPPLSEWSREDDKIIHLTDTILKSDPIDYFNQAFHIIHSSLQQNPSANRLQILQHLTRLLEDLKTNVNPKLSIDQFFFNIKKFLKST